MVAFIEQHGREEVERIKKSMGDEFTIEKNDFPVKVTSSPFNSTQQCLNFPGSEEETNSITKV